MRGKKKWQGRIFISYRRSDSRGEAGRLSDSLEEYFGGQRVFRDIEDIEAGADFGEVIHNSLKSADAMIVLMGPDWLGALDGQGKRRLDDPEDWVAREIREAMEAKIPIFPVLIENTPMPRSNELPESLRGLLRYNALSIADSRWKTDVTRLGKIISFDIPSSNEKRLRTVNIATSLILALSLVMSTAGVSVSYLLGLCGRTTEPASLFCRLFGSPEWAAEKLNTGLIEHWLSGIPFVAIIIGCLLLSNIKDLVSEDKRPFIVASIASGAVGTLLFFGLLLLFERREEPMMIFFGTALTVLVMFTFMSLSGFKSK